MTPTSPGGTSAWGLGTGQAPVLAALALCLVLFAYLANRFARRALRRVRRAAILFVLYALVHGLALALEAAGLVAPARWAGLASTVLGAFTAINLTALAIFDLALPAISVEAVSITTDLLVGLAYIVTILWTVHAAGGDLSSLIATSAVVSGVLALSLQTTLGNIFGGVALQLDGSIQVGDWIQLENGRQGQVKAIRWRHTVLETRDWDTIIVPNAALLTSNIMILGKHEGQVVQHRMWVYFNVDFRYDPSIVIDAVNAALSASPIERVAAYPPPNVICYDLAKEGRDSFAYYAVRYWLTDLAVDDPTSSLVRARIYTALRRADIPLARPANKTFLSLENDDSERERQVRHANRRTAALTAIELFRSLQADEVAMLGDHLVHAPFARGEVIARQGDVADWLFILTTGTADVRVRTDGAVRTVASIRAPDFFGEMGLMTGEPRSADVVATSDVDCYRLDKHSFDKILKARPEIAAEVSALLARRRVALFSAKGELDVDGKRVREASEQQRILRKIQAFFGLTES